MKHKLKVLVLLCPFFLFPKLLTAEEVGESPAPAFFHMLVFEGGGTEELTYAPWGNTEDENATLYTIRAGSFRMSKKFCYYGKSPIRFYKEGKEQAFEHSFAHNGSNDFEQIILIRKSSNGKLQSYGLAFQENRVPLGTFLFQSFATEATFFKVGNKKFSLQKGMNQFFTSDKNTQNLSVKGYLMRNGKYQAALTKNISKPSSKRGIIAVRVFGDMIRSTSLITGPVQKSFVLGYNAPKTINPKPVSSENLADPVTLGSN